MTQNTAKTMDFITHRPHWVFLSRHILVVAAAVLLSACASMKDDTQAEPQVQSNYANTASQETTYSQEELQVAAGNIFGIAAEESGRLMERILSKYGRPTAYIGGKELSYAMFVGLRYGEGTLHHKLEGAQPIKWIGPSLGLDVGGNGGETFQLVYNLYDPENLFSWRPTGEGHAYMMGGFNVSYQQYGEIVIATIKFGVGMRLGINVGANRYSKKEADIADSSAN